MAFEGIVASPADGNVRLLKRLIETNIIYGEYPVAGKYIALLGQTLFYKNEARAYRAFLFDDAAVEKDPLFGAKRKALVKDNEYAVSNYVKKTLELLANHHPENNIAMQYLLALCLTNKDLRAFSALLEKYFRTAVLPVLSTNHQEAVIALEQNNPVFWIKNGVSSKTEQRFRAFDQAMKNRLVPDFEEKIRASFGNTYWYYVLFTKSKTTKANETTDQNRDDYSPRSLP